MRKIVRIKVLGIHPHFKFEQRYQVFLGLEDKTYLETLASEKQKTQLEKLIKSKDAFAIIDYSNEKYPKFVWGGTDAKWLADSTFMQPSAAPTAPIKKWSPPPMDNSPFTEQDLPF